MVQLADHQPESSPETVPYGGAAAPFVSQENHHETLLIDAEFGVSDQDHITAVPVSRSQVLDHATGISSNPPPLRPESDGVDLSSLNPLPPTTTSSPVVNPTPLHFPANDVHQNQVAAAADGGDVQKKKKKRADASTSGGKKKRRPRINGDDAPLIPIGLLRAVAARGGSRPEFLYRKNLEISDVNKTLNRVFLTKGERVMGFLTEEEAAAVNGGGEGLTVVAVDGGGRVYKNIRLTTWALKKKMLVIKTEWGNVVADNDVEKEEVMEIWGYRENGKPCLAFNFRREKDERDGDEDGEGGDNGNFATSTSAAAMVSSST